MQEKLILDGLLPHVTYNIRVFAISIHADIADTTMNLMSNVVNITLTTASVKAFQTDDKVWFISSNGLPYTNDDSKCEYNINGKSFTNVGCNESRKVFSQKGISSSEHCQEASVKVKVENENSPWIFPPKLVSRPLMPILNETNRAHIFQSYEADFCEYKLEVDNEEIVQQIPGPSCGTNLGIESDKKCCTGLIESSISLEISACSQYSLRIRCGNFINITEVVLFLLICLPTSIFVCFTGNQIYPRTGKR